MRRARAGLTTLFASMVAAIAILLASATPASAHVVPYSTIQLAVEESAVVATVDIPLDDLAAATGIDLGEETQADVDAHAEEIEAYLLEHFTPTDADGATWSVTEGDLVVAAAGDTSTTGIYQQLETTFTLTPPAGTDLADDATSLELGYDAVIDKVATHTVIVTVAADSTDADFDGAYEVGTIRRDTVTNTVEDLTVYLGDGADTSVSGVADMAALGISHIREGTDHQLFLLTLLLPAPLLVRGRRWADAAGGRQAVRRITATTLAFTLGHSITLALGALGAPAPQQIVESAIAVSIFVAAVHAVRPIFPGREPLVAAAFGLVHGLAFSETLRELHLSGTHLVLALLGFNLGIEIMQLIVVALVLPPLVMLARGRHYTRVRVTAALITGIAAIGWLAARLGATNPVAGAADHLGTWSLPALVLLWLGALVPALIAALRRAPKTAPRADANALGHRGGGVLDTSAV